MQNVAAVRERRGCLQWVPPGWSQGIWRCHTEMGPGSWAEGWALSKSTVPQHLGTHQTLSSLQCFDWGEECMNYLTLSTGQKHADEQVLQDLCTVISECIHVSRYVFVQRRAGSYETEKNHHRMIYSTSVRRTLCHPDFSSQTHRSWRSSLLVLWEEIKSCFVLGWHKKLRPAYGAINRMWLN